MASLIVPGLKYIHHLHSYENTQTYAFKLKQKMYTKAKALISVSDFIYNTFKLPNNHLIFNPVTFNPDAKVKDIANTDIIRVVTFSSLTPAKGVEFLMQAYQYLPEDLKEKIFIDIYGDGKQYHALKKLENKHVSLKGYCNNIHAVLNQQAYITVVPTVIPESFGLQIVESFSCGVPVIATQIGAQGQLVKHMQNGLLVTIKNPADIAEKIAWMVQNPTKYQQLANQALIDSKLYDLGQFKNSVLHLFEKVLAK
jgi:glycosyltransferase involved in cell wall biosynthesis